jgi:hypothetical protein
MNSSDYPKDGPSWLVDALMALLLLLSVNLSFMVKEKMKDSPVGSSMNYPFPVLIFSGV